jgi:sugar phosphate isomerase/epimerase
MKLGLDAGAPSLDLAVELSVPGVPISADQLVAQGVDKTLSPLRARNLQVCQIGAFGYNPLSTDQAAQAVQSAMLDKAIPLAAETGCPYIVIGPGNYHPSGFDAPHQRNFSDAALDTMARALESPLKRAEKYGICLSIEAYLKGVINSPQRFIDLWRKLHTDALRCNVDPSSLYSFRELVDSRAMVEQVCALLTGHYGLVHIKDIALNDGFHLHAGFAPLGQGPTDWVQMLRLVAPHVPGDSWVIIEHCLTPQQARADVAFLRTAATRADVTLG